MISLRKAGAINLALAIFCFAIFTSLGFWQLNRASDLKSMREAMPDKAAVSIERIAKPNSNLNSSAVNRLVYLKGSYIKTYLAPNQLVNINDTMRRATLEVRLLKLDSGSGILVVRGFEKLSEQSVIGEVNILGRLYPRQSVDVSNSDAGSLSRIDPALVTGDSKLNLIDGYVVVMSEKTKLGEPIWNEHVPALREIPRVAGFYWQHLVYVGIWWLFAVLALVAPFYDQVRQRKIRVG